MVWVNISSLNIYNLCLVRARKRYIVNLELPNKSIVFAKFFLEALFFKWLEIILRLKLFYSSRSLWPIWKVNSSAGNFPIVYLNVLSFPSETLSLHGLRECWKLFFLRYIISCLIFHNLFLIIGVCKFINVYILFVLLRVIVIILFIINLISDRVEDVFGNHKCKT